MPPVRSRSLRGTPTTLVESPHREPFSLAAASSRPKSFSSALTPRRKSRHNSENQPPESPLNVQANSPFADAFGSPAPSKPAPKARIHGGAPLTGSPGLPPKPTSARSYTAGSGTPSRVPGSGQEAQGAAKRKLNLCSQVAAGAITENLSSSSLQDYATDTGAKVIIRVRPLNQREEQEDATEIIQRISNSALSLGDQHFTFDTVAGPETSQQKIFEMVGLPLVENCLAGFNSSIFAYGQTGSGKTYTMWGPTQDPVIGQPASEDRGLTPRVFERLFNRIQEEERKNFNKQLRYQCQCTFLEIYNEQITDLLEPAQKNLLIREDVKIGVYVENLTEEYVSNINDVTQLLLRGLANRRVGATSMNVESSRSHSVFTCVIESRCKSVEDGVSSVRTGRMNLVDLAGSERQKLTGAAGERLKEAGSINRSLSHLGNLINIVAEISQTGKQRHIPYRDSRLTFLLQESLGGNAKLAMICAISPASSCKNETISTLRFAQRAKAIKNKAVVNEEIENDVNFLHEQIRQLKDELMRMKSNEPQSAAASSYSTGWNARRSYNLLRMSLKHPMILCHGDSDTDEEMEIDDDGVECIDSGNSVTSEDESMKIDVRLSRSNEKEVIQHEMSDLKKEMDAGRLLGETSYRKEGEFFEDQSKFYVDMPRDLKEDTVEVLAVLGGKQEQEPQFEMPMEMDSPCNSFISEIIEGGISKGQPMQICLFEVDRGNEVTKAAENEEILGNQNKPRDFDNAMLVLDEAVQTDPDCCSEKRGCDFPDNLDLNIKEVLLTSQPLNCDESMSCSKSVETEEGSSNQNQHKELYKAKLNLAETVQTDLGFCSEQRVDFSGKHDFSIKEQVLLTSEALNCNELMACTKAAETEEILGDQNQHRELDKTKLVLAEPVQTDPEFCSEKIGGDFSDRLDSSINEILCSSEALNCDDLMACNEQVSMEENSYLPQHSYDQIHNDDAILLEDLRHGLADTNDNIEEIKSEFKAFELLEAESTSHACDYLSIPAFGIIIKTPESESGLQSPVLGISPHIVSPVLESPTLSVSPRIQEDRRRGHGKSMLPTLVEDASLQTWPVDAANCAGISEPLIVSQEVQSTGENVRKSSSIRSSLRKSTVLASPTDRLAASLQRGLQILDNHQRNISNTHTSVVRFSFQNTEVSKLTYGIDKSVQTSPPRFASAATSHVPEQKVPEFISMTAVADIDVPSSPLSGQPIDQSLYGQIIHKSPLQHVSVENSNTTSLQTPPHLESQIQLFQTGEAVIAGAIRRERFVEEVLGRKYAEIEQLNRLVRQYKHERECNAILQQSLQDKIVRLESLMGGVIPTDVYLNEEWLALVSEHKMLQEKVDNHPEVIQAKIEQQRLCNELEQYRRFFDLGEREALMEEIVHLRNQLQSYVDSSTPRSARIRRLSLTPKAIQSPAEVITEGTGPLALCTLPEGPCPQSTSEKLPSIVAENSRNEKFEDKGMQWEGHEAELMSAFEESRVEAETYKQLAEKKKQEVECEQRCAEEMREALQMAMEGHARLLDQYAELQEKHISLLAKHRKIREGVQDVKRKFGKAGVVETRWLETQAAQIEALKLEREHERKVAKKQIDALQGQLRDTADAVQAAGELLVRLKEAEEAVLIAQDAAALVEQDADAMRREMEKMKRRNATEIATLQQRLLEARFKQSAVCPMCVMAERVKFQFIPVDPEEAEAALEAEHLAADKEAATSMTGGGSGASHQLREDFEFHPEDLDDEDFYLKRLHGHMFGFDEIRN